MKTKLLGLMALLPLLGLSPANATTYTYSVGYEIGTASVSGTIQTNCNSCDLTALDLLSWSFTISGPANFSISGNTATFVAPSDLLVSPSAITYSPVGGATTFSATGGAVYFDQEVDVGPADGWYSFLQIFPNGQGIPGTAFTEGSITIGTVSSTPLPAALPLFATGLGAMGLLGWRRKRKASAVLVAA
jgi:hypothetical protein